MFQQTYPPTAFTIATWASATEGRITLYVNGAATTFDDLDDFLHEELRRRESRRLDRRLAQPGRVYAPHRLQRRDGARPSMARPHARGQGCR